MIQDMGTHQAAFVSREASKVIQAQRAEEEPEEVAEEKDL